MESLASILLTAIAIALILAYIKGGPSEVGSWLHAKFVGASEKGVFS